MGGRTLAADFECAPTERDTLVAALSAAVTELRQREQPQSPL